jgi:flagellar protein FlaG
MDVTHVDRSAPIAAVAPVIPAEKAAENREVIQAVKALNATGMFGKDEELTFQLDQRTGRMLVRVVNPETKEVLSQIPAEYVLRLVEDLKKR